MITTDITIDDYHASDAISSSKLRDFAARGPRYFHQRYISKTIRRDEQTDAQVVGQAFEDYLCQRPFASLYAVKPEDMSFATKDGKAWKAETQAKGLAILSATDMRKIEAMAEAVHENRTAMELIAACVEQPTVRAEWCNLPVQARPDWYSARGVPLTGFAPFVLDLKTTLTLGKITSGRGVSEYGYQNQMAFAAECLLRNGVDVGSVYLLAVEKVAPYRCQLVEVTSDWLALGSQWCERHLARLARHIDEDDWPRVDADVMTLPAPPPWVANAACEEEEAA